MQAEIVLRALMAPVDRIDALRRALVSLLALVFVRGFLGMPYRTMMPKYAREVMGLNAQGLGTLVAAPAAGAQGELAVVLGAMLGAGMGFLWYNSYPAEVFMGDVGSLALGGGIGIVAVVAKQELLLVLVGGLFVLEALSVLIQSFGFKFGIPADADFVFDLRSLPVTSELYEEPGEWRQVKGDPAIRGTLFQQTRAESPMDRNLDQTINRLKNMAKRYNAEADRRIMGELLVRGDMVMKGYYRNPEATAEAFTEDGWFRTGDLGVFDADNNLYIKGRLKNMIVGSNGENIYPEEIESVINENNFVLESLVYESGGKIMARIHLNYEELDEEFGSSDVKESETRKKIDQFT